MGEVAKCEYDCWAIYIENNGRYPKFNDMSNAPIFSKIIHDKKTPPIS